MGHERIAPQALLKSEPQGKRVGVDHATSTLI